MNIFRKHIKTTPILVIWFWMAAFFADAANLDDLIGSSMIVIHTDDPTVKGTDSFSVRIGQQYINGQHSQAIYCQKHFIHSKTVYDQDSPSLAPDIKSSDKSLVNNLLEKKFILSSISITKFLYLEQRSLLI